MSLLPRTEFPNATRLSRIVSPSGPVASAGACCSNAAETVGGSWTGCNGGWAKTCVCRPTEQKKNRILADLSCTPML